MASMTEPHGTPESHSERDHAPDAHGAAVGHEEGAHGHDEHGHGGMSLGPIDWRMWLVGVIGLGVGAIVTAGFVVATGFSFTA